MKKEMCSLSYISVGSQMTKIDMRQAYRNVNNTPETGTYWV